MYKKEYVRRLILHQAIAWYLGQCGMPAKWLPMKYILSYCGCIQNEAENVKMTSECKWVSVALFCMV